MKQGIKLENYFAFSSELAKNTDPMTAWVAAILVKKSFNGDNNIIVGVNYIKKITSLDDKFINYAIKALTLKGFICSTYEQWEENGKITLNIEKVEEYYRKPGIKVKEDPCIRYRKELKVLANLLNDKDFFNKWINKLKQEHFSDKNLKIILDMIKFLFNKDQIIPTINDLIIEAFSRIDSSDITSDSEKKINVKKWFIEVCDSIRECSTDPTTNKEVQDILSYL